MMKNELTTIVQKRFGYHEITEAVAFAKTNATAGKVLLQPSLFKSDQAPTESAEAEEVKEAAPKQV